MYAIRSYYATTGLNIRKIHSGLPQLISEKMVDLLLSNGYEFNVLKDVV